MHRSCTRQSPGCRRDALLVPSDHTIRVQSELGLGLDRIHVDLLFGDILPWSRCSRRYLVIQIRVMVPFDLRREVALLTSIVVSDDASGFGYAVYLLLRL